MRALSCIPRAERAASPPAAPAPPCARGGARLLLALRSGSAPAVINVRVKRRLKPPQPLPDAAPSCPSCYFWLCRLSLEVLLPADSSGRPLCPEEGPCITLRASLLPCPAPERHRAQRSRRFLLKEILLQVCCSSGVFPQTVFCGKVTALKWGVLCNGAVPCKHEHNTKYLLETISTPVSTILGKNLSPLPPEQSRTYLKICFPAVFTCVILHFFLLLFTISGDG